MPKISVIIPIYGVEKYIERCARSLFEQTLDDIEYLFIDDCTPDRSIEILKQLIRLYPNRSSQVIIHRMDHNSGQAAVRKWGMQNATGDYVIHCDSDDWVDVNMYEQLYECARANNLDIVVSSYYITDCEQMLIKPIYADSGDVHAFLSSCLIQKDSWALWNKLIKRTLYDTMQFIWPVSNMGEDCLMVVQFLMNAQSIGYINRPLYYYYYNLSSISFAPGREKTLIRFNQFYDNAEKLIHVIGAKGLINQYKSELTCFAYYVKSYLAMYVDDGLIYRLWRDALKDYNKSVLCNNYISIFDKARYVLTVTRLYPYLKRI